MTTTIRCHFDGKVLVPDETVNLPVNRPLLIRVEQSALISPSESGEGMTAKKLLDSKAVGMWADRTDITDSTEFARELRRNAERRGGGL